MTGKKTVIISLIIIVILFGAGLFVSRMGGRISSNPSDLVGNTAGNLNNGGYFCEADGYVYFANAYDEGTLYRMKSDGTEIKKINKAEVAYLNVGGDYVYYYQKNSSAASSLGFVVHMSGLYRCRTNGKKILCLDKSDCKSVILTGNTLYYNKPVDGLTSLCLFRIGTDKKNAQQVTDYLLNPVCAQNGVLYYNGTKENHYLYSLDTATGQESLVLEYNTWYPVLYGDSAYFLDIDNDYRLCRYGLYDQTLTVLTADRVDAFNLCGNYIYYQKNDASSPALMCIGLDGSNPQVVAEGIFSDINVTSSYVYFHPYGESVPMYRTPSDGSCIVSTFDDARDAALAQAD